MNSETSIRVVVTGALGNVGQEVIRAVLGAPDLVCVGAVDPRSSQLPPEAQTVKSAVSVDDTMEPALYGADVLVDFTHATAALSNVLHSVSQGVSCVVGTTGLYPQALTQIDAAARERGVGVLVAPNFALGAVLMMRFAEEAARYFEWAEIVEMHHERKIDAPSGTALMTATRMASVRAGERPGFRTTPGETEKLASARGATGPGGIHIHAVRMPGLVAHQMVMLGGEGETLTIRHDSTHRSSFMAGVLLAIRRIRHCHGLQVGLERLLD